MRYEGKHLPAWVRFRRKPEPLPVYTVPTLWEHWMAELASGAAQRLARSVLMEDNWLSLAKGQTGPLRVMLPNDYAKRAKG